MRTSLSLLMWGYIFLSRGLMAEQTHHPLPQEWVTIKDDETGLRVDFPHHPLEMTFDLPFQNTPPTGQIHLYSVPIQSGLLVLGTFHSSTVYSDLLEKEKFHQFFETVFIPHFFYNPTIFQNHQIFHFHPNQFNGKESPSFQFFFQDHGATKKLEGIAFIKGQTLYIPFYISSEKDFNTEIFNHFLHSIHFP